MKLLYATFVGVITAVISMMFLEGLGHYLFPLPFKIDSKNLDDLATKLDLIPAQMYLSVVFAHGLGLLIGLIVARAIDKTSRISLYIIAGFIFIGTIMNLLNIPHPLWFGIADVVVVVIVSLFILRKPLKG